MKKIKILQFPVANSQGGITQYVLQNWKFIDKSRFQFDFATMSKKLDFAEELEKENCQIFYISRYAEDDEKQFNEEFRRILLQGHYDVVHLHTKQWKSFNVERIAKEVGVKKIIVHAHNAGIDTLDAGKRQKEEIQHYRVREKLTEDVATNYWACSKAAATFLFGDKIPTDRIKIMNNAIDILKFGYDEKIRLQYRKEMKIEDKFVLGNIGRLAFSKNQEFIINMFAKIYRDYEDVELFIVGDGELKAQLKKQCDRLGIEDHVHFLGKRKDTSKLYQMMDLFLFPSNMEGLGLSLIEAQASGIKCICSDAVPKEAVVTENVSVLPLEIDEWIKCIERLSNYSERKNMYQEIRDAGYDIKEQIKAIEEEYALSTEWSENK